MHVCFMLGLAWLTAHKRLHYVRRRELLVVLAAIHVCWTSRNIGARLLAVRSKQAGSFLDGALLVPLQARSCSLLRRRPLSAARPPARPSPCPPARPPAPAATRGGTNIFFHHGDSPLRLLGLLLACSHAIWGPIYLLHNRIAAAAGFAALLLAALLPLLTAQSICHRLLLAPGILAPLADLHAVLGAIQ